MPKKAEYPPRVFKTRLPELIQPSEVTNLAAKIGITPMTLRRIIKGCDVKMTVAFRIAKVFDLTPGEIWHGAR